MTERQKPGILVCGDVAIDWIDFPRRPETRPDGPHQPVIFPNWKLYPGIRRKSVLGGTWVISKMLKAMAGSRADVYGPAENALTKGKTNAFIQSFLEAGCYEKGNKQKPCWRVVKNGGFNGPDDTQKGLNRLYEDLFDRIPQNVTFDLIIVDDSANGIRGSDVIAERLKKSIGKTTRAVIYKLFRPLGPACKADNETSCGLFQSIQDTCQAGNVPLVVIIDVNDLRAENAGISRGLSWERTSWEIIRHLQKNPTQVHFSKEESIPS